MNNEFAKHYQEVGDNWKDKVQYGVAATSFLGGITMGFISYLTSGTISGDVLGFIGECFTLTGGIFGITLYIRNKVSTAGAYIMKSVEDMIHKDRETFQKYAEHEDTGDMDVAEKPLENRR